MLFSVLVWTWWWQKAVLAAEDSLSLLLADGSLRGCAMGEGGESSEYLQLAILGKAVLFWAFLSWKNWLLSTVFSKRALEFLMLPLCQVWKMLPSEARRSSYRFSMRWMVKGSSSAPPKSTLQNQVQVKVIYKAIPPLCLSLCAQEWGEKTDRAVRYIQRQDKRLCIFFSITSQDSVLLRTMANNPPKCCCFVFSPLMCFKPLCSMLSEAHFLSEKQVLS